MSKISEVGGLLWIQFDLNEQYPCSLLWWPVSFTSKFTQDFRGKRHRLVRYLTTKEGNIENCLSLQYLWKTKRRSQGNREEWKEIIANSKYLKKGKSNSREVGLTLQEANFTVKVNRAFCLWNSSWRREVLYEKTREVLILVTRDTDSITFNINQHRFGIFIFAFL